MIRSDRVSSAVFAFWCGREPFCGCWQVYVWGRTDDGRLGLGRTSSLAVRQPTLNADLSGRGLRLPIELGCTSNGTLAGTSLRTGGYNPWV